MRKKRRPPVNPWRILLLVLLIGAAVYVERVVVPTVPPLFVPTSTPTRSPASILLEAESLFQAGKLHQAMDAYGEAIRVDPGKANYYIDLARVHALSGDLDQAETSARDALLIDQSSAQAYATLAWVLDLKANQSTDPSERLDLLDEARENIDRALQLNTNLASVHAYHAEILIDEYILAGEDTYQQALAEAQKAVQTDPNSLYAHRALGVVWEATGNYESAMDSYQAALRLNNNLALLHLKVGDMYMAMEPSDVEAAVRSYVAASSFAPSDTIPLRRIVRVYARIGQYARASQYAEDAVRLDPDNASLHGLLGQMHRKNGDLERAVESLGRAIHGGSIPGVWTVSGREIEVTEQTEILDDVALGDDVRVQLDQSSAATATALRIEIVGSGGAEAAVAGAGFLEGRVESMRPPVLVQGLSLDDPSALELYYTYALALAETNRCELAAEIARAILLGVPDDEIARFNAEEALRVCGGPEVVPTPTPSPTSNS